MSAGKRVPVHFDEEIVLVGKVYYYRGTPFGTKKRREVSLGLEVGAKQKDILRRKSEVLSGLQKVGSKTGKNSFEVISEFYIKHRTEEAEDPTLLSKKTLSETKQLMKDHLVPFFGRVRIEEIDQAAFTNYCANKKKQINLANHRKVMNHFLKWCVAENYLKYRHEIVIPKKFILKHREREVLSESEILKLLNAMAELRAEGLIKTKHILYVVLYIFMGMRNMEICKLRWDEVNLEKRALKINKLNNRRRKERAVPINSHALILLQELYQGRTTDWVFPSAVSTAEKPYMDPSGGFRNGWEKALERAQLGKHITPHDCRSTFETFMHTNVSFTDTQREKMAGASIDVQKNIYVNMEVEHLRGLEESVQIAGVTEILGGKRGGESQKEPSPKRVKRRNQKGKSR
jgi:integrase